MAGERTDSAPRVRLHRLRLTNFLSYRDATLELGDLVALVGPNASGKSNAVAAVKLLRDIPLVGLPTALARRGGFEQIRRRTQGHSHDPAVRIEFRAESAGQDSFYELRLTTKDGHRYEVVEDAELHLGDSRHSLAHSGGVCRALDEFSLAVARKPHVLVPPGQSVVTVGVSFGALFLNSLLAGMQTVEINPARVADLQDTSSTQTFEPDGSNAASLYEDLSSAKQAELVDELAAIVPGIRAVDVRRFADRLTLVFRQSAGGDESGDGQEFLARYMSDGTLRSFGILLALQQPRRPCLVVIEEPEIAIHLGALQTLVDILRQHAEQEQILLTTHSADIVDTLDIDALRVVWNDGSSSRVATVASHTKDTVRRGLITPGELLRVDSLDPAVP